MEKRKRPFKKRNGWSKYAEALLLEVWAEKIGDLRGIRKNSHVYAEMVEQLQNSGVDVNADGIRVKIKNFTAKYRYENWFLCFAFFTLSTFPLSERKKHSRDPVEDLRRNGAIFSKFMKFWALLRAKMLKICLKKAWNVSGQIVIFYFLIMTDYVFFKLFHQRRQHQPIQHCQCHHQNRRQHLRH